MVIAAASAFCVSFCYHPLYPSCTKCALLGFRALSSIF